MPNIHGCLKQLNIPLAVASSSAMKSLRSKLTELKLIANFEPHIYSGEQVKRSKPHPDLFLFVAKRLQIDAKKCVVIEDSVNGVMSAFAAGMTVIGFTGGTHCLPGHGKQLAAHGASSIITDMNELSLHLNLKRRI
jgi:HAD superfamily hydrolase (TIGR01509 family)